MSATATRGDVSLISVVLGCKTIGEVGIERPCAISVPTIVKYKGIGGLVIYVVELFLPMINYVNALFAGHVASVVSILIVRVGSIVHAVITYSVVAVDVEFVP